MSIKALLSRGIPGRVERKKLYRLLSAFAAELFLLLFVLIIWESGKSEPDLLPVSGGNVCVDENDLSAGEEIGVDDWIIYSEDTAEELFADNGSKDKDTLPVLATTVRPSSWMITGGGLAVSNESERSFTIDEILNGSFTLKVSKESAPQILIVHTHGTEGYNTGSLSKYRKDDELRSSDTTVNVVAVGSEIEGLLTEAGYTVIHDMKMHDDPDFNSAYSSSRKSIKKYLDKYPTISVVLDIHRDTVITSDGTKYRPIWECDGQSAAQIMFLMGAGGTRFANEHWKDNLRFALLIARRAEELYPDMMRPLLMRSSLYNQDILPGSLLVEIGTCGNTLEEALLGAEKFTECLIYVLDTAGGVYSTDE